MSETDLSLLYDTQKTLADDENIEHSKFIANLGFVRSSAEGAGALLGGALAMISFDLMVLIQSLSAWMCLVLALVVIDPPYKRRKASGDRIKFSEIISHKLAGDPMLRKLVFAIPLYNLATFHMAGLIQPYWEQRACSWPYSGHCGACKAL